MNFLNATHDFLWREICGAALSGKTRWLFELSSRASSSDWDVHFFGMDDYEYFLIRDIPINKNTLLIFDDADTYIVSEKSRQNDAYTEAPSFDDSFLVSIKKLIERSSSEHKLRLLFSYTITKHSFKKEHSRWWNKFLDNYHPFIACRVPGNALDISWTIEAHKSFVEKYINQHYKERDPVDKRDACKAFADFCAEKKPVHIPPLMSMICIDAFFDRRDFETVILSLLEKLLAEKKIFKLSISVNEYIDSNKDNLHFFHMRGRLRKSTIDNSRDNSDPANPAGDQGRSREW